MIFYHPIPIKENGASASAIRPYKMLAAFRSLGIDVDEVTGYGRERKQKIQDIKNNIKKGIKYDFAYGENTTLPFLLTEPSHYPLYPFLDYFFFKWLNENKIPFGLFYRDIYWRFPEFRKGLSFYKWATPLPFHYIDIFMIKKFITHLFLPSKRMADFLPGKNISATISSLPSGSELFFNGIFSETINTIEFFYVGGVTPPNYDLSPMFDFFSNTQQNVHLNLCCREKEWLEIEKWKRYKKIPTKNITIYHYKGKELHALWLKAHVFLALWENVSYRNFAMPFKISEAIGYGVPIITTRNTAAGDFVKENDFGWAIEPTPQALSNLIERLKANPNFIKNKKEKIVSKQKEHTWEARALKVISTLTAKAGNR